MIGALETLFLPRPNVARSGYDILTRPPGPTASRFVAQFCPLSYYIIWLLSRIFPFVVLVFGLSVNFLLGDLSGIMDAIWDGGATPSELN